MKMLKYVPLVLGCVASVAGEIRFRNSIQYSGPSCRPPSASSCRCTPNDGSKKDSEGRQKISVRPFLDTQAASRSIKRIALTTAVNYADKLALSLACNRAYFDEYHVLHGPEDHNNLAEICAEPKVKCHETKAFKEPAGATFNKGRALGEAQKRLHSNPDYNGALIVLLDADICLPQNFALTLPQQPKPDTIYYTTARYIYCNAASMLQRNPDWVEASLSGALGFFQAYVSPLNFTYSDKNSTDGSWSDVVFAKEFPHKQVLQDLRVHMLGSSGNDWKGRDIGDARWSDPKAFVPQTGVCQKCEGFFRASGIDIPWRRGSLAFNQPVSFGDLMYN
jgi:hypothetical protein